MYEISTTIFFASTSESLGSSLHYDNPYHVKTNRPITRENMIVGHIHERVLEFQEKGENNRPLVTVCTVIIPNRPLYDSI